MAASKATKSANRKDRPMGADEDGRTTRDDWGRSPVQRRRGATPELSPPPIYLPAENSTIGFRIEPRSFLEKEAVLPHFSTKAPTIPWSTPLPWEVLAAVASCSTCYQRHSDREGRPHSGWQLQLIAWAVSAFASGLRHHHRQGDRSQSTEAVAATLALSPT